MSGSSRPPPSQDGSSRTRSRRGLRIAGWVLGLLVGLPLALVVLLLAVVLIGANTGPGRRLIERQAASLSGGLVALHGLGGRFPDALKVDRLEIHDTRGVWLAIDHLVLDWSPLRLLALDAHVEQASADRIEVPRLAVPDPNAKPSPPARPDQKSGLHLGVLIDRLHVGRIDLGAPVAGTAVSAGIDGHARIADLAPLLGGATIANLPNTDLALSLARLDHPGHAELSARVTPARLALHLKADDPADGFVTVLAHMPVLDPLHLSLDLDGPRNRAALTLAAAAGAPASGVLTLAADGSLDLLQPRFDVQVKLDAPAMQPMAGVAWNKVALDAHIQGTPQAPFGQGNLVLDELSAAGAGLNRLTARFDGAEASGPVHLHAVAEGIRIPGPKPLLLAGAPLTLDATLDPYQAGRPLDLVVSHPLAGITGRIVTAAPLHGQLVVTLPDLAPLAAAGGMDLQGNARLAVGFSQDGSKADVTIAGPVAITGGQPQAAGLIGPAGQLALAASKDGSELVLRQLKLDGQALHLTASGTDRSNVLDARFALVLPALERALPSLRGALSLAGNATGPTTDLAAHITADGNPGTATMATGPLHLLLDARHLPSAPEGTISLTGTLDRAPLTLKAQAARLATGALHLTLDALSWKSAIGHADMTLPAGAKLPLGTLDVRMARLGDLQPVIGQPVAGSLLANIRTAQTAGAGPRVTLDVRADGGIRSARVGRLLLAGTVDDPIASPSVNLRLDATGIAAGAITGNAHVVARGPQTALDVTAQAILQNVAGAPARLDTALRLDLPHKQVAISRLEANAKGENIRLLAPARIGFGTDVMVDRLRLSVVPAGTLGATPATIDVAGRIMPRLELTATVANVTPALARPFAPTLDAVGVIAAQARLTGTTSRPAGTVHLTGDGLRLRTGPAASLPAARLVANLALAGTSARVDVRLDAGPNVALTLAGTAPTSSTGALALRADGTVDLGLANAVLGAEGRQVSGRITLAMGVAGTVAAPQLDGTVQLAGGGIQDFAQGLRLTDISALIRAQGQSLAIENFTAHAGGGAIGASGTVGALVPGLPVDLRITAKNARPLSSDLLTAVLDADIRAHGQAAGRLDVGGTVTIDSASINIPNGLPPSVAQLKVIRPDDKPAPVATAPSTSLVGLDLTLNAPGQIFVRGHGLDAELGGKLHVGGTSSAPAISGGFDMRRGTFDLAGISLTFTKGKVGFNGTGVAHKIDPTLDFTAESVVSSTVARLNVGGYADAPKITLSSTPSLPQDQVLALLLFGQNTKSLSPLQIAQVAAGLASLTGAGGGFDPLGTVRKKLGLDRLAVGSSGSSGTGASVEAGKYVARGVYVGAKQATSGGGSQATVQIDLTRRLKLQTTVGTGGATTGIITPENDPGSSVALKYQFQY